MTQHWTTNLKGRRKKPGEMNKTEAEYAEILATRQHLGEILWYTYEGLTFKLADDTRWTPDFCMMMADGTMEVHEVKGFWRDGAKMKIKVAARLFPFRFLAVRKRSRKEGGGFEEMDFTQWEES